MVGVCFHYEQSEPVSLSTNLFQPLPVQYLDCLFDYNPKYGGEFHFHERQVDLYAKYDPDKLLLFLRSCNDIPLQKVKLTICHRWIPVARSSVVHVWACCGV